MGSIRSKEYQKDEAQESLLDKINSHLELAEQDLIGEFDQPSKPVYFIVGPPRSGTTLVSQLLSKSGEFGYISNYIARFWNAPTIAYIQQQVLDLTDTTGITLKSDYGRTKGLANPHEFGYFWQRFLNFNNSHQVDSISDQDGLILNKTLDALQHYSGKPLLFKNLTIGLNMGLIKQIVPTAKFIVVRRHPYFNAESIYRSRMDVMGSLNKWFSLKPVEIDDMKTKPPIRQICLQIYHTLSRIEDQTHDLGEDIHFVTYDNLSKENEIDSLLRFTKIDKKSLRDKFYELILSTKPKVSSDVARKIQTNLLEIFSLAQFDTNWFDLSNTIQ